MQEQDANSHRKLVEEKNAMTASRAEVRNLQVCCAEVEPEEEPETGGMSTQPPQTEERNRFRSQLDETMDDVLGFGSND